MIYGEKPKTFASREPLITHTGFASGQVAALCAIQFSMSEESKIISAATALSELMQRPVQTRAVDVRSAGEFAQGSILGFISAPILTDSERHEVGLCYKEKGQAAAVELGYQLTRADRDARVQKWVAALSGAETPIVTCWRGGLRSEIAADWIRQAGQPVFRVEGGYKALRQELVKAFESLPEFFVLAGPTGAGKTTLLNEISTPKVDLEKLANHRGSAFGGFADSPQPRQASFENSVAFKLNELAAGLKAGRAVLVEDESANIGSVKLPAQLKEKMSLSPVIKLNVSVEERARNICEEYVGRPLREGLASERLFEMYDRSLLKIQSKLGGAQTQIIRAQLKDAFSGEAAAPAAADAASVVVAAANINGPDAHLIWITSLLVNYYDKLYQYSFNKHSRKIIFEGDHQSCKTWIQNQYA